MTEQSDMFGDHVVIPPSCIDWSQPISADLAALGYRFERNARSADTGALTLIDPQRRNVGELTAHDTIAFFEAIERGVSVVIAGSRSLASERAYEALSATMAALPYRRRIIEIISGTAAGVDRLGERWATEHGIALHRMPANWGTHGKAAGHLRNTAMAKRCNAGVVVYDGASRGTAQMLRELRTLRKPTTLVTMKNEGEQ